MLKFSNILMVGAWDVTRFYAMLTFCINLIVKELFKIVFLLETIFIFPLSLEACMVFLAKHLSATLRGRVYPPTAWCLELFINGD